jgi:hypothetical protein
MKRKHPIIMYEPESDVEEEKEEVISDSDREENTVVDVPEPSLSRKERMNLLAQTVSRASEKKKKPKKKVVEKENESSEDEEEEEWEMDHIVCRKYVNGEPFYKIRWTGFSSNDDTWEPTEHLSQELIDNFERAQTQRVKSEHVKAEPVLKRQKIEEEPVVTDYKTSSNITPQDLGMMGVNSSRWLDGPLRVALNSKEYGHFGKLFQTFSDRKECSKAGIMKQTMWGIGGRGDVSADAVVCTGGSGYNAQDFGNVLIYSGQGGGIDKDQQMTDFNLSLKTNMREKIPVRLVRASTLNSKYAPLQAYRYDGLYFVTAVWSERLVNNKGPKIYLFRLVRCPGQATIPTKPGYVPNQFQSDTHTLIQRAKYVDMLNSSKLSKSKKIGSMTSGTKAIANIKKQMAKEESKHKGIAPRQGKMSIPVAFL